MSRPRRRGHQVHVKALAGEVERLRGLGLAADPIAAEGEGRELDDWTAGNPTQALERAIRTFADRAAGEIDDVQAAAVATGAQALLVDTNSWGAQAVAESSGLPWAVFQPYLVALPAPGYFVVATSAAHTADDLRGADDPNIRVERFLSHGPVIERADVVICHGGMGITQRALSRGMPVVVVPFGRDQPEVARRVEYAGAGVRLDPKRLEARGLTAAVREAVARRDGARRLAGAFAQAGADGAAADAFEELQRATAGPSGRSEKPPAHRSHRNRRIEWRRGIDAVVVAPGLSTGFIGNCGLAARTMPGYTGEVMATKVSVSASTERELLTAQDFLDRLEPGRRADLIDGEVFMHSPVSTRHADLLNFVDALLRYYIDRHDIGRLYREVVAVRLSGRNVFLPDLAFYRSSRLEAVKETHVEGAPDLVVEALSPRTAERDVGPKFAEYEQHGVREYWVLDPETLAHRFYRLEGEELVEYAAGAERIDSEVVEGFFLMRSWLDPSALPKLDQALGALPR